MCMCVSEYVLLCIHTYVSFLSVSTNTSLNVQAVTCDIFACAFLFPSSMGVSVKMSVLLFAPSLQLLLLKVHPSPTLITTPIPIPIPCPHKERLSHSL